MCGAVVNSLQRRERLVCLIKKVSNWIMQNILWFGRKKMVNGNCLEICGIRIWRLSRQNNFSFLLSIAFSYPINSEIMKRLRIALMPFLGLLLMSQVCLAQSSSTSSVKDEIIALEK